MTGLLQEKFPLKRHQVWKWLSGKEKTKIKANASLGDIKITKLSWPTAQNTSKAYLQQKSMAENKKGKKVKNKYHRTYVKRNRQGHLKTSCMISHDCKHVLGQCHSVLNSPDRNHCILKTWGTDRKTPQNNTFSNLNAQTPAKGEIKNKKEQVKRQKGLQKGLETYSPSGSKMLR